jgi:hypothetical protein
MGSYYTSVVCLWNRNNLILEAQIILYMDSKVKELELQTSYQKLKFAKMKKKINKNKENPNICDGIQNKRNPQKQTLSDFE